MVHQCEGGLTVQHLLIDVVPLSKAPNPKTALWAADQDFSPASGRVRVQARLTQWLTKDWIPLLCVRGYAHLNVCEEQQCVCVYMCVYPPDVLNAEKHFLKEEKSSDFLYFTRLTTNCLPLITK